MSEGIYVYVLKAHLFEILILSLLDTNFEVIRFAKRIELLR